jgi:predicted NUDIX family NTP pyrophosphohydrolase
MPKISAGLLMYRQIATGLEVLLVHPGGPFYVNRDAGHWGIPKGLVEAGEDLALAAIREFEEETGLIPQGPYHALPPVQYRSSRKWVHAWAFAGAWDPSQGIRSNTFEAEWPPRSGQMRTFPEVDRAAWFGVDEAQRMIHPAQWPLVEALVGWLG